MQHMVAKMAFASSAVTPLGDSGQTRDNSAFLTHSRTLAATLNNIGAVHQKMGKHSQSLECYQLAVKVRMELIQTAANHPASAADEIAQRASAAVQEEEALLRELGRYQTGGNSSSALLDLYPVANGDCGDGEESLPDVVYSEPLLIAHRRARNQSKEDLTADITDHRDSGITLFNMGLIHAMNRSVEKAQKLFDMAKSVVKPATEPALTACILNNLARLKFLSKDRAEAFKILKKALHLEQAAYAEEAQKSFDKPSLVRVEDCIVATLSLMSRLHYEHGDANKALELGREVLRIRRSSLGDGHIDVACSLFNIGLTLNKLGEAKDALEHCKWFASRIASLGGRLHPDACAQIGNALHAIGMLHLENDSVTTAIATLEQALAFRRSTLGRDHPDVADSLYHLGQVMQDTGRDRQAMENYREAVRIFRAAFGADHEDVAVVLCNMGQIHQAKGELDEALTVYNEVLRIAKLVFGAEDAFVAEVLGIIGNVHLEKGETAASMERFAESTRISSQAQDRQGGVANEPVVVPNLAGFRFHLHAAAA